MAKKKTASKQKSTPAAIASEPVAYTVGPWNEPGTYTKMGGTDAEGTDHPYYAAVRCHGCGEHATIQDVAESGEGAFECEGCGDVVVTLEGW